MPIEWSKTKILEKLVEYKKAQKDLCILGPDIYRDKPYDHILPLVDKKYKNKSNIIEYYRDDFYKSELSKIKYHTYFHHLNSSQAMCINFFYPLIKESQLNIVLEILNIKGAVDYKETCFEKEGKETEGRKTNFDFYIRTNTLNLYFEIKYTEPNYSSARDDGEHKRKYERVYRPFLTKNKAIRDEYKEMELFFKNYQILRNLLHIDGESYVIFVYLKDNPDMQQGIEKIYDKILIEQYLGHFIAIDWHELFEKVMIKLNLSGNEKLQDHYNEFQKKYLNYVRVPE